MKTITSGAIEIYVTQRVGGGHFDRYNRYPAYRLLNFTQAEGRIIDSPLGRGDQTMAGRRFLENRSAFSRSAPTVYLGLTSVVTSRMQLSFDPPTPGQRGGQ